MDSANTSSIINKILEMDLSDEIAMKNVIDVITSHPCRSAFFLGNLLGTSTHQSTELIKTLFFYHDAYTPDDLYAYIFGKKGGPFFLVNIVEKTRHRIPFEYYGSDGRIEDIPIPPVHNKEIENLVRIDVTSGKSFTVRHVTVSEAPIADGRFYAVPIIDVNDVIMSLHRRDEGYKAIEELTNISHFYEDVEDVGDDVLLDTFENKILNYVHQLQRNIQNVGDLAAFATGMLLGVNVNHPYAEQEHGQNILAVRSPVDNGTLFMIAFEVISRVTRSEKNCALESNMHNLLTHYVPDDAFDANHRNDAILLAITYNVEPEPEFDSIDTIVSLRCSTKTAKDFEDVVEHYLLGTSLMDRCRYVIRKNKRLMTDRITDLPQSLQSFIRSSDRSTELIKYRLEV